MKLVADASVIAKWVLPEPDSKQALALRTHEILVPDIALAELANLLTMRVIRGEMSAAEAGAALRFIQNMALVSFPCMELATEALAMSAGLRHPAYDLFYVALARQQDAVMVTADTRLVAKIRALSPAPSWGYLIIPLAEFQPG